MFSFVIPTHEREANLRRVLSALTFQTDDDFEVIVADDGSTDGTAAMVREMAERLPLKYCWNRHEGARSALARSLGTKLRDKKATHVWFLDSDIVIPKDAVAQAKKIIAKHPDAVLSGRYDWLNKYVWPYECGADYWEMFSALLFEPDHRTVSFDNETVHTHYGCVILGGNVVCPVRWLRERAFDETIIGGGQDGEFSYYLQSLGAPLVFSDTIRGLHMWHPLNRLLRDTSMALKLIRARYSKG